MISASQIRKVVAGYLSHKDSDRFVREFAQLSYNIHKNGDAGAVELVRAIDFKMADLRSGCIEEKVFFSGLRELISVSYESNNHVFAKFCDPVNRQLQADPAFQGWSVSSGTSPSVVFGSVLLVQS